MIDTKKEIIEFGKWYQKKMLGYCFEDLPRGTNAIIRGDLNSLHQFTIKLNQRYLSGNPADFLYRLSLGNLESLQDLLKSGKSEPINFVSIGSGDDRIRGMRRMDLEGRTEGPFTGSNEHMEFIFNEQRGGEYPTDLPISMSSRATMINHVLDAIEEL